MGYNANNGRLFVILRLDFHGNTPLYIKIRNQVILAIAKGEPTAGKWLPAIQTLPDETGINMMTICKAYPLLKTEGYVHNRPPQQYGGSHFRTICRVIGESPPTAPPFEAGENPKGKALRMSYKKNMKLYNSAFTLRGGDVPKDKIRSLHHGEYFCIRSGNTDGSPCGITTISTILR